MAQFGVSIVKSVLFRGVQQEFSNVYHYRFATNVDVGPADKIAEIVAVERQLHSASVKFLRASLWSSGGSPAENTMLHQETLTGTGSQANIAGMDRERAFLTRWRVGVDRRGKPVYLRKWYHSCGAAALYSPSTGQLENTQPLDSAGRSAVAAKAEELREIGNVEAWNLCSPNGNRIAEQPAECHPYLEHHQLGDMWR